MGLTPLGLLLPCGRKRRWLLAITWRRLFSMSLRPMKGSTTACWRLRPPGLGFPPRWRIWPSRPMRGNAVSVFLERALRMRLVPRMALLRAVALPLVFWALCSFPSPKPFAPGGLRPVPLSMTSFCLWGGRPLALPSAFCTALGLLWPPFVLLGSLSTRRSSPLWPLTPRSALA